MRALVLWLVDSALQLHGCTSHIAAYLYYTRVLAVFEEERDFYIFLILPRGCGSQHILLNKLLLIECGCFRQCGWCFNTPQVFSMLLRVSFKTEI